MFSLSSLSISTGGVPRNSDVSVWIYYRITPPANSLGNHSLSEARIKEDGWAWGLRPHPGKRI